MADLASNWIEVFENVSKQVNGLILWRRFCGFELPKPKAVKVSHQSTQDGWGSQRTTGINPLTTKIKISFFCTVFHTLLIRCQLKQNYKPMFSFLLIAFYFTLIGIIIRPVRPRSCKPIQNRRQWKLTCVGWREPVRKKPSGPAITRLTCKNLNEKKIENGRKKVWF